MKTTDYGVELEQPAKGAAGFFGSMLSVNGFVTDPVYRLTFGVSASGSDVLVTASEALIQNPHTGKESPVRLDRKKHEAPLWDFLESLKSELGHTAPPPQEAPAAPAEEGHASIPWPNQPASGQVVRESSFGTLSFYDRFEDSRRAGTDSSEVVVSSGAGEGALYVMAQVASQGDTLRRPLIGKLQMVLTGALSKSQVGAAPLIILADAHRLQFSSLSRQDLGGAAELLTTPVAIDTLLLITDAQTVEGRLGTVDFAFTPHASEAFRGLAQLVRSIPPSRKTTPRTPVARQR
jgi:hypothetical protein